MDLLFVSWNVYFFVLIQLDQDQCTSLSMKQCVLIVSLPPWQTNVF